MMSRIDFPQVVRNALDELDPTPGRDHWEIRNADSFALILLTHLLANAMALEDADAVEVVQ